MVASSAIGTYADLDVFRTQAPATVTVNAPDDDASSTGVGLPGGARGYTSTGQSDREWDITVDLGSKIEMRWLRAVWEKTGRGTLPARATPPGGGAQVPVLIVDNLRRVFTARGGQYRLRVREFDG